MNRPPPSARAKPRRAIWRARRLTWLTAASGVLLLQTPQCIVDTARWLFSV